MPPKPDPTLLTQFRKRIAPLRQQLASLDARRRYLLVCGQPDSTAFWQQRERLAAAFVDAIGITCLLPESLAAYREAVRDGACLFFNNLSRERFLDLFIDQLVLPEKADKETRLATAAAKIPLLQKLGQTVARQPTLPRKLRKHLARLELGLAQSDQESLLRAFREELASHHDLEGIFIDQTLIGEGSVAAVVRYRKDDHDGVFKFIKADARRWLEDDLSRCAELVDYYESSRQRYSIEHFRFADTFRGIDAALRSELDLVGEQQHIREAAAVFRHHQSIALPGLLPEASPAATAMTYVDGRPLTETGGDTESRNRLASLLMDAIVLIPLFSQEKRALFHGDPHAGNIFVRRDGDSDQLVLLDWSQAGHLTLSDREAVMHLCLALAAGDSDAAVQRALNMSQVADGLNLEGLKTLAGNICRNRHLSAAGILEAALNLLDRAMLHGLQPGEDLLLFRKSLFTVKALIHDYAPSFSWDGALAARIGWQWLSELPLRSMFSWMPLLDSRRHYASRMSNLDLWQAALTGFSGLAGKRRVTKM